MPFKRFYRLQRARLAAAPLALRPTLGWRGKLLGGAILLMLAAGLLATGAWLGWQKSERMHRSGLSGQAEKIAQLDESLASAVAAQRLAEQQLAVERSTRQTLARELAQSQAEAASRQESLALLDSLLTANDRSRAVRFVACELQMQSPQHYRYRALLAQGFNSSTEFNGQLQVSVDYLRRNQRGRTAPDHPVAIKIRHYERAEGELSLPDDAVALALDMRILTSDGRQLVAQCQKKTGGV